MSAVAVPARPASGPPLLHEVVARWLPIEAGVTLLTLLIYASVQQAYRQGANDPQIQIAEDAARAVAHGADPASLVSGAPVDIAASAAVWTAVVDGEDRALAANLRLDGHTPLPPAGVFADARRNGENRVTRAVIVVGRSLRDTEWRVDRLGLMALAAWLATSLASLIATAFGAWLLRR
jgi:hypothetical protein